MSLKPICAPQHFQLQAQGQFLSSLSPLLQVSEPFSCCSYSLRPVLPKNVDKDDPSNQALQRGYELNRLSWHLRVTLGNGLAQRETKYTSNSIFLEFISCCFPLTSLLATVPRMMPCNGGLCFAPGRVQVSMSSCLCLRRQSLNPHHNCAVKSPPTMVLVTF